MTYNLRPYIGSQTFLWSLVQVSSKLSSFPCALSAKCAFLGLLRESVRRVYGTPMLPLKYSFTGLLPTFVLESFWRSISTYLTWISCGDWIDRRRHSKTFIFAINQLVFCNLKFKSSCSKTTWVVFFTTKLVIAAWLMNSIEIFLPLRLTNLTAWFNFSGLINELSRHFFSAAHTRFYDLQTESNFYNLTHFTSNFLCCFDRCIIVTD